MAPRNLGRLAEAELSVLRIENRNLQNKKRKYSPIVWDRDDKGVFRFLQVIINQGYQSSLLWTLYQACVLRMENLVPHLRGCMVDT